MELIWIHGAVSRIQFGDHYLQVLNGDHVPQSISWAPVNNPADLQKRKLEFYPSQYGYQALLDISLPDSPQSGGHRVNPYALLARSFSTLVRATFPVNERANYVIEMILYLRSLYNRVPQRQGISHNPWIAPRASELANEPRPGTELPSYSFTTIKWENLTQNPSWERGPQLTPPARPRRGSALSINGPRPVFAQRSKPPDVKSTATSDQSRKSRPGGVFGAAMSAVTGASRGRSRVVSVPSTTRSAVRVENQASTSSSSRVAPQRTRSPSQSNSNDSTLEEDSSKDPLDVISLPDMTALTISNDTTRRRPNTLGQHPATSSHVRVRSGGGGNNNPHSASNFAVPSDSKRTPAISSSKRARKPSASEPAGSIGRS